MEKKYLVAKAMLPMMGETQVVFDDVKNFEQTDSRLAFDDKDGRYEFEKVNDVWHEINDKAPDLIDVKTICRRTARKHDLVGDNRTEANSDNWRRVDREAQLDRELDRLLGDLFNFDDEDYEDEE